MIHKSFNQRRLGSNNSEINFVRGSEIIKGEDVISLYGNAFGITGNSRVARRTPNFFHSPAAL